jgi:hypothetical protein
MSSCQRASRGLQKAIVALNGVKEADPVHITSTLLNALMSTKKECLDSTQGNSVCPRRAQERAEECGGR